MSTPGAIRRYLDDTWYTEGTYVLLVPTVDDLPAADENDIFAFVRADKDLMRSEGGEWVPVTTEGTEGPAGPTGPSALVPGISGLYLPLWSYSHSTALLAFTTVQITKVMLPNDIDQVAFEVTSTSTGATPDVAFYEDTATGPGALYDTTGTMGTSVAFQTASISVPAGVWWVAVGNLGASNLNKRSTSSANPTLPLSLPSTAATSLNCWIRASTSAWPDPWNDTGVTKNSSGFTALFVRAA